MTSVEVCRRARAEHGSIKGRLARLETLADGIAAGKTGAAVRELEDELEALRRELRGHLAWEDGEVSGIPGAERSDSERAAWLRSSHDELRIVLDFCGHSCSGENHPVLLVQRVRDLAALLRRALEVEEDVTTGRPKS